MLLVYKRGVLRILDMVGASAVGRMRYKIPALRKYRKRLKNVPFVLRSLRPRARQRYKISGRRHRQCWRG